MPAADIAHLELLGEIDALLGRLERWAADTQNWLPADRCRAIVRRLARLTDAIRLRIDAPLVVAALGGTGTGKSALMNAILGDDVLPTGRMRPTTMRPMLVCRPDITPEMLGIDPACVELLHRDLPALRNLVLIDCPDPDTTEKAPAALAGKQAADTDASAEAPADSNLARLRAILPFCDVLLVTATQQKYRSARVAEELRAAVRGARVVYVQTHADEDPDVRDDWRQALADDGVESAESAQAGVPERIYRVDSLAALGDVRVGRQPRGEFTELMNLLARQLAGATAARIRRANFLDLAAAALDACRRRVDESLPAVQETLSAIEQQRERLARLLADRLHGELATDRRQWEGRMLAKITSRWGFSPFALVLRVYQGLGGLISGALLYRVRTPAQAALWGTLQAARGWRRLARQRQSDGVLRRVAGWDDAELRKAALIVDGYAAATGIERRGQPADALEAEARTAAAGFMAAAAGDLDAMVARAAARRARRPVRWFYELLLSAMLGLLLYRLGKNFFYDSWLAEPPAAMFGLEFYFAAAFWFALWCALLLWAFCGRMRRGLHRELAQLATQWRSAESAAGLFARLEDDCRRALRSRAELDLIAAEVEELRRGLAAKH
jgi:hypothetical protein